MALIMAGINSVIASLARCIGKEDQPSLGAAVAGGGVAVVVEVAEILGFLATEYAPVQDTSFSNHGSPT